MPVSAIGQETPPATARISTVDTSAPVVSVNTVAGDDILNNAEQAVAQIISGQVSGASPGDTVTVKLGTHVLTGIVLADGSWNVALDPAVTRTLDRGANTIFVTVTDACRKYWRGVSSNHAGRCFSVDHH
ncbi:hypothetical protein O5707_07130 [Escherichia coli]|nr:hypothetical protein [Escherichia coli]